MINVSSKQLTLAAVSVLQKGLNFAVTPKVLHVNAIVVATEEACRHLVEEKEASLHSEVANTIKRAKPPHANQAPDERKAIHELKGE